MGHLALDEGLPRLRSFLQPRHTDGLLGPVVSPVQVIGHPVHCDALYSMNAWQKMCRGVDIQLLTHRPNRQYGEQIGLNNSMPGEAGPHDLMYFEGSHLKLYLHHSHGKDSTEESKLS